MDGVLGVLASIAWILLKQSAVLFDTLFVIISSVLVDSAQI